MEHGHFLFIKLLCLCAYVVFPLACDIRTSDKNTNIQGTTMESAQLSTAQPEIDWGSITDPEVYLKYVFAHMIQKEMYAIADLPRISPDPLKPAPETIEANRGKNLLVPVQELLPHIIIIEIHPWSAPYRGHEITEYTLQLDEEGQNLVIASKGDEIRDLSRRLITEPNKMLLEIRDGQFYIGP